MNKDCFVSGHYLKFYKQITEDRYNTKCVRCGIIIHVTDKTFYKRKLGEYNL